MNTRARLIIFLIAAAGFATLFLWGLAGLPSFGNYQGPYGLVLNRVAVPERHVTDVVAAVNFDYRGVDTIGEEFILFVAVAGVAAILRTEREEIDVEPPEDDLLVRRAPISDAVRVFCLTFVALIVVLGWDIVAHGHLTPGGGFQGGAILASGLALVYLAGGYRTLRDVAPERAADVLEAIGAGGFVVIGLAGFIAGAAFLQNIIPLGPVGLLYSAGTIPLNNLSVGIEVAGGLLVLFSEFLRQALQVRVQANARKERKQP